MQGTGQTTAVDAVLTDMVQKKIPVTAEPPRDGATQAKGEAKPQPEPEPVKGWPPEEYEALERDYMAIVKSFATLGKDLDLKDTDVINEAFKDYNALKAGIVKAIKGKKADPADVRKEFPRLGPLFGAGWKAAVSAQKAKRTKAATEEHDQAVQAEEQAAKGYEVVFRDAERKGLTTDIQQRTGKLNQIKTLTEGANIKDRDKRLQTAKSELAALEARIATLQDPLQPLENQRNAARQRLEASKKGLEAVKNEQAALEKAVGDQAHDLDGRVKVLLTDNDDAGPLEGDLKAAVAFLDRKELLDARWALDALEKRVTALEARLKDAHPERESFLTALASLEERVEIVLDDPLVTPKDQKELSAALGGALALARQRSYDQAKAALKTVETRAGDAEARIKQAELEQEAYERALEKALDLIDTYKEDERRTGTEIAEIDKTLAGAEDLAEENKFVAAKEWVEQTLIPQVNGFISGLEKWTQQVKKERKPTQPPDYDKAADDIVRRVIHLFNQQFDYAGPGLRISEFYPKARYNPGRLKRMVGSRFRNRKPVTDIPGIRLSARCYFNLGQGGTTKGKDDYNVKVKLPGVDRALAQIHLTY